MGEVAADQDFTLGLEMTIAAGQLEAGAVAEDGFTKASFGGLAAVFRERGAELMMGVKLPVA